MSVPIISADSAEAATGLSQHNGPKTDSKKFTEVVTGTMHMVSGAMLMHLGIVAIIIKAYWSYFAAPIWTGLVIIGVTGFLGIMAGKTGKLDVAHGYIVMSVVSAMDALFLIIVYSFAAAYEHCEIYRGTYYCNPMCHPGGFYSSGYCASFVGLGLLQAVDALIVITALFELVLAIVSVIYGCYYSVTCCVPFCQSCCGCCAPLPSPTTVTSANNAGGPAPLSMQEIQLDERNISMQVENQNATQQRQAFVVQQNPINPYDPGVGPSTGAVAAYRQSQDNPVYSPVQTTVEILPTQQEQFV